MSGKGIGLALQSARDALGEAIQEMKDALRQLDELDEDGAPTPISIADLERMLAQCQAVHRKVDSWSSRF